jgi:hypothetical protein
VHEQWWLWRHSSQAVASATKQVASYIVLTRVTALNGL